MAWRAWKEGSEAERQKFKAMVVGTTVLVRNEAGRFQTVAQEPVLDDDLTLEAMLEEMMGDEPDEPVTPKKRKREDEPELLQSGKRCLRDQSQRKSGLQTLGRGFWRTWKRRRWSLARMFQRLPEGQSMI